MAQYRHSVEISKIWKQTNEKAILFNRCRNRDRISIKKPKQTKSKG